MALSDIHNEPVLETEQLESLLMAAGAEGLNEIMDAYWRSTQGLIDSLKTQAAEGDLEEAARTAHAIKGSSSNIGAQLMANLAKVFENACRDGDGEALRVAVDAADDAVDATRKAVTDLIAAAG